MLTSKTRRTLLDAASRATAVFVQEKSCRPTAAGCAFKMGTTISAIVVLYGSFFWALDGPQQIAHNTNL
jgi:hypothetical protein